MSSQRAIPDRRSVFSSRLCIAAMVLSALVGLFLGTVAFGAGYQAAALHKDTKAFTPPGRFVGVGGHALHVHCEGAGGPTVVLENGMGGFADQWAWVRRVLAPSVRVCSYDRAGTGFSEPAAGIRDAGAATADLRQLIRVGAIKAPVVIAGHSYGGLVARVFADRYPAMVAGLVLVDSSHEDMGERFPPDAQEGFRALLDGFALADTLNRFGVPRLTGFLEPLVRGLPPTERNRGLAIVHGPAHMGGAAREAAAWDESAMAARNVDSLGDIPLHVLAVDGWPDFMLPEWLKMQRELARLSTIGTFTVLKGADHGGAIQDREHARRVAAAITDVIAAARAGGGVPVR